MKNLNYTLEQSQKAQNLIGKDITEMEYAEHLIQENGKMYFLLIHLNGNERMLDITEVV